MSTHSGAGAGGVRYGRQMANLKSVFLGSWLGDKLMRDTIVVSVTEMGPRFRRVVIRGLTTKVEPGDKIQIYIPDAGSRTYSPFAYARPPGRSSSRCSRMATALVPRGRVR